MICARGAMRPVLDVITCAKFQKFVGVTVLQGVEFSIFLLILNGPYNSAALLRCL